MKVAVVYCYPLVDINKHFAFAKRFAETWARFPPTEPHELHIVCNGASPSPNDLYPFRNLAYQPHARDNFGWDIGAFQWAGEHIPCDLMVCLGAPVHFYRPGWLERIVESYLENGPGFYGCWAYTCPLHIRTTAFWLPPQLLNAYPNVIGSKRSDRYEFEHGGLSMTRFTKTAGLECYMVTTTHIFAFDQWENNCPGLENSLFYDQHIHR